MKGKILLICVILTLVLIIYSCARNEKMRVSDDRILDSKITRSFLINYLSRSQLSAEKDFVLDVSHKNDSLLLTIYPILQKIDSIGSFPISCFSYEEKRVFVRNSFYYFLLVDPKSETLIRFRGVIQSKPIYNVNHKKYPQWSIKMKDGGYSIDTISRYIQVKQTIKFHAP